MPLDFEAGLFGQLRAAAGDAWTGYVRHPFVLQLGRATLPEACFRRFLVQDYLFLIQFARAYGLSAFKSATLDDLQAASTGLQAILTEIPLHVATCAGWGLTEEAMAAEPEASETMTYTRYVLDVGMAGDLLDLTVALMPCVAGYAEVGQWLQADPGTVRVGSPYAAWLDAYAGEAYQAGVRTALDKLEGLGRRSGGQARFAQLSTIFTTATRLEAAFWQMGLAAAAPTRAAIS